MGVRGFIIDVFPISSDYPIRIEFFGDEIDSIREFDQDTQKSIKTLDKIIINPFTEFLLDEDINLDLRKQKYLPTYLKDTTNIESYLEDRITIVKDYIQIHNNYLKMEEKVKGEY